MEEGINFSANSLESNEITSTGQEAISDLVREQMAEEARQIKIVWWAIKKDHAQNNKFAKFLIYLLWEIQSDELINTLYKLFFTTKDPYHGTVYIRKSSNYPVMIWLFVPFFWEQIVEYKLNSLYQDFYTPTNHIHPKTYLHYLKQLALTMHDNIALDIDLLTECILLIFEEFQLLPIQWLDETELQELNNMIRQELW